MNVPKHNYPCLRDYEINELILEEQTIAIKTIYTQSESVAE